MKVATVYSFAIGVVCTLSLGMQDRTAASTCPTLQELTLLHPAGPVRDTDPWYAKFSGMDVKYPMHYVPEVLMLGLTVAGLLAM